MNAPSDTSGPWPRVPGPGESSGPFAVAPQTMSQTPGGGMWNGPLDVKTVALLALFVGGAGGGGLISSVGTSSVQTALSAVQADLRSLQETTAQVQRSLVELQSGERSRDREAMRVEKKVDTLEGRVRELEDRMASMPRRAGAR